jgi:uncharacterized protein (TIGR04255 family)
MIDTIHFERAPLEEVVCGVHFTGVNWSDIHFGLFFNELCGRYQQTQRRSRVSLFDPSVQDPPQITFLTEPELPLLWYESPESPFLLQVQNDTFFVNWRRQSGTFDYPHFRTREGGEQGVWHRFVFEWDMFRNFCTKQAIGTPEILACHLAYIDHMVQGETWQEPVDLVRWFRPLAGLRSFEAVSVFSLTVGHEFRKLPVRINVRPAIRTSDKKKLFIFEFVITQKLPAGTSLESWFDKAHAAIIEEFVAQTTEDAHAEWGLTYG